VYRITLFHRDGEAQTPLATTTAPTTAEIPTAARALAADHGLPTGPIETSGLLTHPGALRLMDSGRCLIVGLTVPDNPTLPDNMIAHGVAVERIHS
jgi:hypothetical protein